MMDCRTFALLLDRPEGEWTAEERQQMEAHAAQCAECGALLAMRREMAAMDAETEVPAAFSSSWREKVYAEEKKMSRQGKLFPWKRAVAAVAAVAVLAIGTTASYLNGWGLQSAGKSADTSGYDGGYGAMNYAAESYDGSPALYSAKSASMTAAGADWDVPAEAAANNTREEKIIRTINMTIKTRQYEADYALIRKLTEENGGRVESLDVSGDGSAGSLRRASFVLRVPSERLDAFIAGAKGVGTVSAYSESSDDVSESYYDMQNRLQTQQVKMQRLTALMEKAEDVSDLIELENAVSETQYWIDYYTGQMNGVNSRVQDSYVNITLRELSSADAAETKTLSLGERIVHAVKASAETAGEVLQAMLIFLVAALPWIAVLAVITLVIRAVVRKRKAKRAAKTPEQGDA